MAACVEVFACEGALSAADERLRFVLCAYSDTSLSVTVERIGGSGDSSVTAGTEEHEPEDPHRAHFQPDAHGEHAEEPEAPVEWAEQEEQDYAAGFEQQSGGAVLDEDHPMGEDGAGDADQVAENDANPVSSDCEYVTFDGNCMRQFDPELNNEYFYVVRFKLVRWSRRDFSSSAIHCVGHLSAREGFAGEYISLEATDTSSRHGFRIPLVTNNEPTKHTDEGNGEPHTIAGSASSHRIEPLSDQLYPLTPGEYELSGYTIAENGYVYRCLVNLKLHANGQLSGSSQELLFPQVCELVGSWSRVELSYTLRYTMGDRVCEYMYHCSPFLGSMRGWWQNSDLDAQRSSSERGCLEFSLVSSRRHWSEQVHCEYPLAFRKCIRSLLLVSLRGAEYTLPSHLWTQVVAFCDFHWFRDDDVVMAKNSEASVVGEVQGVDDKARNAVYW
ncbi:hypothetical protein Gpo141_00006540 [Globisporangium polare]